MPSAARKQVIAHSAYALDELTLKLSMARGLDEVMEVVRRFARPLVRAEGATFVLRDNGMCHYADEDAISPLWKGQRFPAGSCISGWASGWALLHGQTVVIEDIYADIPLPGRIMAVADVYDALVSKRRYKPALPHLEAVAIIAVERGRHFDPVLVDVFLEVARDFENIHRYFAHG